MAQHFSASNDGGNSPSILKHSLAVVEALEARQLLSGSTGAESMLSLLDPSGVAADHAPAKHAHENDAESSQTALTRNEVRIAREIAIFTTHIHHEVARHADELSSETFQQHIAREQARFAQHIAKQGGTYTPIPASMLFVASAAAASAPNHAAAVVVSSPDPTPPARKSLDVIHPATSPSPTPTPTPTPTLTAPTVTGKAASATSNTLTWTTVTGATGYRLDFSTNAGTTWTPLESGTVQTYTQTGLTADTAYSYRVSTLASGKASAPSTAVAVTTLLPAPSGFGAATKSPTEIDLTWIKVTDATSYKLERSPDGTTWTTVTPSPALSASSVSYADTTAVAGTTYYYRLSAIDAAGTSAACTAVHTQTLPAAPVLTGTVASATEIDLSWVAITGATSYKLETSLDGGNTWSTLATPTTATFVNTGLTANTSYEYRVSANDSTGSSTPSSVVTDVTLPVTPSGLSATAASATAIDLTWAAVPGATSYKIERSANQTTWATLVPSPALTGSSDSYSDTTATAGATFYYRISTIDAAGTSAASSVVHALTYTTVPTVTATATSASVINLSWVAPTGATSYVLQSSANGGNTWTTLASPTALTYSNTGLTADTTYQYRVQSVDATGSSANSAVATAKTWLAPATGLTATVASATEIDLTWTAVADATSYTIQRSLDGNTWTSLTPSPALTGSSVSYANTGLTGATTYYYHIAAVNALGTSAYSSSIHALTTPTAPTLTATVASLSQVNLTWTTVTGATSYKLETSLDGGVTWSTLATPTVLTYSNTGLSADSSYKYRVSAVDATGASPTSAVASVVTYLATPTGLAVTPNSPTGMSVTWTPEIDATSYTVQRSPDGNTWTTLTPSPALTGSSSSYTDTGVTAGTTYYYRISAVDSVGSSAASSAVHALTYPSAPTLTGTIASATVVNLSWTASTSATSYTLQSSPDGFTWTTLSSPTTATYSNTGLTADTAHYYRVSSNNATGSSPVSNVLTETTILSAPSGVAATAASATEIDVTWSAVPDATSYIVQRSLTGTSAWTSLTPSPALTGSSVRYADTTASAATTYYYQVMAVDASGTSAASSVVHALTLPASTTLTATVSSATQINLSWTASTGATSYTLQTSTDGGNTWTTLTTPAAATTYSNTGLTADTAYKYRVVANDATGASASSSVVTSTTIENAPAGFTATAASATAIALAWTPYTDASSYKIERSANQTTWAALAPSPALTGSSATFTDTTATAGSTYYYRISTISASGTSVPSTVIHLMTPPLAPTLTATVASSTAVNLSWTAATSATSYFLEISANGGTSWTQEALPVATTFSATSLSPDTLYKFRVSAVDAGGTSSASAVASATTFVATPAAFTAAAHTATEVDLAWTAVTDATSYKIERSVDDVNFTTLTPSPALTGTSSSYADTTVVGGTYYYYRISASDLAGSSAASPIDTVLTYPAALTLTATAASTTQINLSWTPVTGATSYQLQTSTNAGTSWTTLVTQAGTTYVNTGLTADTSYDYEVTAINATGNSTVSTAVTDSTLLAVPVGLTASAVSATEIDLAWTPETDATSYLIQRSTNQTTWTTLTPSSPFTGSSDIYADTNVVAGTTYYYTLSSIDAAGTSAATASATALTVTAASTVTAAVISATQVNLTWTAVHGATSYELQSMPSGGTGWTTVITQPGTTYANTGLTADTMYEYQVIAIDATGNSAASPTSTVTTLLAAPSGLAATPASATEIDLAWTAETDATNYLIQRSINGNVWTTLAPATPLTGTSSSYADTTVSAGTTYMYNIVGVDAAGNSAAATAVTALTVPAAPTVTGTPISATQVNLTWNPVKGATSYTLQDSTNSGTSWTTVVSQTGTSYSNTGLTADTTYEYQVLAVDATGNSAGGTPATVTTILGAPTGFNAQPQTATDILLGWTPVTDATSYTIQRSPNGSIWTTLVPSTPLTGTSSSYSDTTVVAGTNYYYNITAVNALGPSVAATAIQGLTTPAIPTLTATATSPTQVNLSWTAVKSATSYQLEISTNGGTSWTMVVTQAGTTYSNTGLTADTAYEYSVFANNASGGGATSNPATNVTTLLNPPSGLAATVASATEIDLAWTAETDATNYLIQRSTNGTTWTTLTPSTPLTGTSSSYADTTVSAGTTYYYTISGVDAAGTSAATTPVTALTLPAAPTLSGTVVSATQLNFTWTPSIGATSYALQNSTNGGTSWTTVVTQAGTTYANTGLNADTAYEYQVMAIDATGNSVASTAVPLTTLLGPPGSVTATAASATEIDLAWTAETDATNYVIQRSFNQLEWTTLTPATPLTGTSSSYADTMVSAGVTYYYRIEAMGSVGTTAPSTVVSALSFPATPTLAATVSSATQVNLIWKPSLSATSYALQSSTNAGTSWTTIVTQAGTSYANTGLTADTAYEYQVIAINASGDSAASTAATVTTLLATPTGFAVTAASATENDLAWTAVTDATSYKIQRSTNQTIWTTLAPSTPLTGTSSSYADTTAVAGTTYYYNISAVAATGTSATATAASVLTLPATPTLTATPLLSSEIYLTWTPVASATSYQLQTSTNAGTSWTTLATQAGTTYANTGLTADTAYEYEVTAINATGNSAATSAVTATTVLAPPTNLAVTTPSDNEASLSWTAVTDATSYQIEVSSDQQVWTPLAPATPLTGSSATYNDTATPQPGATYYYRIEAINAQGVSVPATAVSVTMPLAAPTGLTAAPASGSFGASQINLTWNADTSAGLSSFTLQYSPNGTTWTDDVSIAPESTATSDIRLTANTQYYYQLIAVNAGGNSAPSNVVNATTT